MKFDELGFRYGRPLAKEYVNPTRDWSFAEKYFTTAFALCELINEGVAV
jgi:hypothetical protein